jgi:hypothetical protein
MLTSDSKKKERKKNKPPTVKLGFRQNNYKRLGMKQL